MNNDKGIVLTKEVVCCKRWGMEGGGGGVDAKESLWLLALGTGRD